MAESVRPAFTSDWPPRACQNGIVSYTHAMVEGLRGLGMAPLVLTGPVAAEYLEEYVVSIPTPGRPSLFGRIMWRCFPARASQAAHRRRMLPVLCELAASGRVDLLETEESFGAARALIQDSPVPIVVRLHGPWFLVGDALGVSKDAAFHRRVKNEGRLIAAAAGVSAPSEATLTAVREYYGQRLSPAAVVPNPTAECAGKFLWSSDGCEPGLILFVGRFDRCKGGDLILQAFRAVAEKFPTARLAFAGPDRGMVNERGVRIGIEAYAREHLGRFAQPPHFTWLGPVPHDELAALRKRAAMVVVASRFENFPMVLLEAFSQGCPVVASAAGGIPEILHDGQNGLLFRNGDAEDLASKIETLLENPDLAARLGQAAHDTWRTKYHPEVVARAMMAFYGEVVSRWKGEQGERPCPTSSKGVLGV